MISKTSLKNFCAHALIVATNTLYASETLSPSVLAKAFYSEHQWSIFAPGACSEVTQRLRQINLPLAALQQPLRLFQITMPATNPHRSRQALILCTADKQPLGTVDFTDVTNANSPWCHTQFITRIHVHVSERNQGYGSALLHTVLQRCTEPDCIGTRLFASVFDYRAQDQRALQKRLTNFYERHGGVPDPDTQEFSAYYQFPPTPP